MSEYILIMIWIGLCAFFARHVKVTKAQLVLGVEKENYHWLFALILIVPLILMAGLRSKWFSDAAAYTLAFQNMPTSYLEITDYLSQNPKDPAFSIFSILIKIWFQNNIQLYYLIIAFIQCVLLSRFFRQYSNAYITSIFLFVASTDYMSWMFNGIRQFMAVTIILAAAPFIFQKKYIPSIIIILVASTFHQSALIMIPIIFIIQGQAWNKKTALVILAVLLAILFIGSFTSLLDSALGDTQYKNVVSDYKSWNDDGTNPLRVAVYSVPAIISFVGRKKIRESNNSIINICTNMSIISAGLYLISMVTSGIFLGRLPIYCSLFSYILLPWEINNIIHEKYRTISYVLMILFYLVFYYYQMHITWQLF